MKCDIQNLTFTYDGGAEPVFSGVSLAWDSSWRLGLTGRNGRGKTTLLRLLCGELEGRGSLNLPVKPVYFPFAVTRPEAPALAVMTEAAAQAEEWRLSREANLLGLREEALSRPFATLSRGEQTKALLCALFAREDVYPLIDEPTNHLDLLGRETVAAYLRRKDGFLLISHDRAFLNDCVDHMLSINKTGFQIIQGDYDTWQAQFDRQNEWERKRDADLQRDIARLTESAAKAAQWSKRTEKSKYHVAESQTAALDRGYVGARSAAMMKRSLNTVNRRERAAAEKQKLLHNVERVGEIKLTALRHPQQTLVTVENGKVGYDGLTLCEGICFKVKQGERIALTGPNGCGKSSVLKTLCGLSHGLTGTIRLASGLAIAYLPQETDQLKGSLSAFIQQKGLDESLFKAILRNMDFSREQFEVDMSAYSQGQKKKALLAASLCAPAHLFIWDEPLNDIDVLSRRQLEAMLLQCQPTMLLTEHDRVFLDRVCTGTVAL